MHFVIYRKKLKMNCIKELPTALHRVINFDLIYFISFNYVVQFKKISSLPREGKGFSWLAMGAGVGGSERPKDLKKCKKHN